MAITLIVGLYDATCNGWTITKHCVSYAGQYCTVKESFLKKGEAALVIKTAVESYISTLNAILKSTKTTREINELVNSNYMHLKDNPHSAFCKFNSNNVLI